MIDDRLRSLCGSDLTLESTRALLQSLSPEIKQKMINTEVIAPNFFDTYT